MDIHRLAKCAEVIVAHDSEDSAYAYNDVFRTFAYQLDVRDRLPWTSLLSNYVDVSQWSVETEALGRRKPEEFGEVEE